MFDLAERKIILEIEIKVALYIGIILFLIGLIGNFFCFMLFSRSNLKQFPLNLTHRVMSISDTLCLFNLIYYVYIKLAENDLRVKSNGYCQFFRYISSAVYPIKAWMLVFISFERLISINYVRYKSIFKENKFQLLIIGFIYTFNFIFYVPILIYARTINSTKCGYEFKEEIFLAIWNFCNETVLTLSLMSIITLLIGISMYRINSKVSLSNSSSMDDANKSVKNLKFTITSISMNLVFLMFTILCLPLNIYRLILSFDKTRNSDDDTFFYAFSSCLAYCNFAFPFFVYVRFHSTFRKEFFSIFNFKII